jgi:hypothetical protein
VRNQKDSSLIVSALAVSILIYLEVTCILALLLAMLGGRAAEYFLLCGFLVLAAERAKTSEFPPGTVLHTVPGRGVWVGPRRPGAVTCTFIWLPIYADP